MEGPAPSFIKMFNALEAFCYPAVKLEKVVLPKHGRNLY